MKAVLQTTDGGLVTDFQMPEFQRLPEVAIFGSRTFTLVPKPRPAGGTEPHGPDDEVIYKEGVAWSVDASKAFEENGLAGSYRIAPVDTLPAGSEPITILGVDTLPEPITILEAKEGYRIVVDHNGAHYVAADDADGDGTNLGLVGYNAYKAVTGGFFESGDKLPEWDALMPAIQEAWEQAAMAVGAAITPGTMFEVAGSVSELYPRKDLPTHVPDSEGDPDTYCVNCGLPAKFWLRIEHCDPERGRVEDNDKGSSEIAEPEMPTD